MKTSIAAIAATALTAAVLAGCSSTGGDGGDHSSAPKKPAAATAAATDVVSSSPSSSAPTTPPPTTPTPQHRDGLALGAKAPLNVDDKSVKGGYAQVITARTVPDSPGLLDQPNEMIYAAEVRVCVGPPKGTVYLTDQVWQIQFTNDTFGDSSTTWSMPNGEAMYPSQFNVPAAGGCAQGWIQALAQKGLTMATILYSPTDADGNPSPSAASWKVAS